MSLASEKKSRQGNCTYKAKSNILNMVLSKKKYTLLSYIFVIVFSSIRTVEPFSISLRPHPRTKQTSLRMIITGPEGKPAESPEEDLDITRQLILDFQKANPNGNEQSSIEKEVSIPQSNLPRVRKRDKIRKLFNSKRAKN